MSVDLKYKHQQTTYKLMNEELEKTGKVAYVFPTGAGKSFPALKYIEDNPSKPVIIVAPSIAILNQYKKYINEYIPNGNERIRRKDIVLVTYQNLSVFNARVRNANPGIILLDEGHRIGAKTWEPEVDTLIEKYPEAKVMSITATPERMDKRNMLYEKFQDSVVYEMSLTEALSGEKEGEVVLEAPRYIRVLSELAEQLESYKIKIEEVEDENKRKELLEKYEKLAGLISRMPSIQEVMQEGMQKKNGKYIVFCADREEMQEKMEEVHEIFGRVNDKIRIDYVLSRYDQEDEFGKTQKGNRLTIEKFEEMEKGEELQLLFCVDMLNEGVHIQGIDGVVMFRPTESGIVYKQQIGRALSVGNKAGETVIIDAVNNWKRQEETFKEIEAAIGIGERKETKETKEIGLFNLKPEEIELIELLREIGEETHYNYYNAYKELIEWLETHNGKMPRARIQRDGQRIPVAKQTKEENDEVKLYRRWNRSVEKQKLESYVGKKIEEIPEEDREMVITLREYGLGLNLTRKPPSEEIIEWLETHNGKMPRVRIKRDGQRIPAAKQTKEEKDEVNLRARWNTSIEKQKLESYVGKKIEEIPEEDREMVITLREYGLGLNLTRKPPSEEIIEWLETHNGKMPRSKIKRDGQKRLSADKQTKEENDEVNLYRRWNISTEKQKLELYVGKKIEEIPEEDREMVITLREYGLGLNKRPSEEIIEWLETHNGKMPRPSIYRDGQIIPVDKQTEEENDEVNLRTRWNRSIEKQKLESYIGKKIEEIPEEDREMVATLRMYDVDKTARLKLAKKQRDSAKAKNDSVRALEKETEAKLGAINKRGQEYGE